RRYRLNAYECFRPLRLRFRPRHNHSHHCRHFSKRGHQWPHPEGYLVTQSIADRAWARYTGRERWTRLGIFAVMALAVSWSLASINIIWPWVWDAPAQISDLAGRMMPPDFSSIHAIVWALIETLNIATIATFISIFVSLPVAYISAQNTTPNQATLWLGRFILVSSRSVNTLIWALLFVAI